jgi:chromosome segregation ATPase
MTIPSVVQGLVEAGNGKAFKLDSSKGSAWLESIGSFRFEPSGDSKPCTIRKEASGYWYGCRKVAGKVRKKYIGKSSEISVAKLEEVAAALEIPPSPKVDKVAEVAQEVAQEVAEVAQEVAEVAQEVAEVAQDRLTALELEVANLRKALEALQVALPGKLESSDSAELPKVGSEVVEWLQNDLGNLKAENETLKADYAKLLESSTVATKKLDQEVQKLRSQLEAERADREEIETELSELKQKSVATREDVPEAADLLNQLKAKRKKSKADLADLEIILGILES